jgi:hypothetical protein
MTDIATLFARDPLKHTREDVDAIIAKMREARHTFNLAGKTPAQPKLTKAEKEVEGAGLKLSLNLKLGGPK